MAYAPPPPTRPIGVAILALLVILAGLVLTILTLLVLLVTLAFAPVVGFLFAGLAFIAFFLSLLLLLAGIGLWKLRPWAWWLSVIVLILGIANQLGTVGLSGGLQSMTTGQLVVIGIPILILIYLVAVRGHFRSAQYAPR